MNIHQAFNFMRPTTLAIIAAEMLDMVNEDDCETPEQAAELQVIYEAAEGALVANAGEERAEMMIAEAFLDS